MNVSSAGNAHHHLEVAARALVSVIGCPTSAHRGRVLGERYGARRRLKIAGCGATTGSAESPACNGRSACGPRKRPRPRSPGMRSTDRGDTGLPVDGHRCGYAQQRVAETTHREATF
jgi:hypothetical protein